MVNAQSDGDIGEREIVAGGEVQEAAVCVLHRGAKDYSPLRILANSLGVDSEKAIAPNAYSRVLSESGESQKALGVQVALMLPRCNPLYSRFLYDWRWARYGARRNFAWKNSASRFVYLNFQEEIDCVAGIGQILPRTASSAKG